MLSTNNLAADRLGQSTDGNSHSIYDNVNGAIHESLNGFRGQKCNSNEISGVKSASFVRASVCELWHFEVKIFLKEDSYFHI